MSARKALDRASSARKARTTAAKPSRLDRYAQMRDFGRTREPAPSPVRDPGKKPIFVVQLHHASHRHYDFRLQVDDTLRSWAVPKGPSFDPHTKRLAMEVEDHPLDYASFEGEIPQGEYGGGHVAIFDHGTWTTPYDVDAQFAKGHLQFTLAGRILKGAWHLVRSQRRGARDGGKTQWLLFKAHDEYAGDGEADDFAKKIDADAAHAEATRSERKANAPRRAATVTTATVAAPSKPKRSSRIGEVTAAARRRAASTKQRDVPATAREPRVPARRARAARRAIDVTAIAALAGAKERALRAAFFAPMLTKLRDHAPEGTDWLHETKWDGYRIVGTIVDGKASLWSRNAIDWTDKLPGVVAALESLPVRQARVDGELIAAVREQSDFNALQATLSGERDVPLLYVLFDLPHLEGYDLSRVALTDRKALLERLVAGDRSGRLRYSAHHVGDGGEVFAQASAARLEGIVSKRVDSHYRGGRGDDWVKVKRLESDEFAIVGYTAPRGSRTGLGSLLLARPGANGEWHYAGRAGSGLSGEQLRTLSKSLAKERRETPPVMRETIDPTLRGAHWVEPTRVVEVYYRGMGGNGLLRQPSFKTLREDKTVKDLREGDRTPDAPSIGTAAAKTKPRRSAPARATTRVAKKTATSRAAKSTARDAKTTPRVASKGAAPRAAKQAPTPSAAAPTKTRPTRDAGTVTAATLRITHPERVVYAKPRTTKQDVVDYYRAVMPWLLPELRDRPLSVIRCPDGAEGQCFFQKHGTPGLKHVPSIPIRESDGHREGYLYVRDELSVVELVQFGALEFHPWGATIDDPESADRLVFDLDPGPGVTWSSVVDAAKLLRDLLAQVPLRSFVRTSGGKGLHVVVPLKPAVPWPVAKDFCQAVAISVAQKYPARFVATASKQLRDKKIFIDWLRNARGATSVASYSLRARAGAPVAMPLAWDELGRLRRAHEFDIATTPRRLARRRREPWPDFDRIRQSLDSRNTNNNTNDKRRATR